MSRIMHRPLRKPMMPTRSINPTNRRNIRTSTSQITNRNLITREGLGEYSERVEI